MFGSAQFLMTGLCVCVISVRIWDVRPYAPHERCVKIMSGHQHTFEKVNQWRIVSLFSFVVCFCFSLWLLLLLFWWRILSVHQDKTCFDCLIDELWWWLQLVLFHVHSKLWPVCVIIVCLTALPPTAYCMRLLVLLFSTWSQKPFKHSIAIVDDRCWVYHFIAVLMTWTYCQGPIDVRKVNI